MPCVFKLERILSPVAKLATETNITTNKTKEKPYCSVTPGKGQYGLFESLDSDFDVKTLVVPVPTKNFAGVYAFKSGNLDFPLERE